MRILIIGSKGYIGSFLYENLSQTYDVEGFDSKNGLEQRGQNIDGSIIKNADIVIYLAGLSGRKQCLDKSLEYTFNENVDDIMKVAYKMRENALLIYASTASLYEGYGINTPDEKSVLYTDLYDEYTKSMWLREQNIKTLTHIRTAGLRFGTVIGLSPQQRVDLVHIALLRSAVLTGVAKVFGANQNRAILWNRDLLEFMKKLIEKSDIISGNNVYNVASLNSSVAKIANEIGCRTGCNVVFEPEEKSMKYNIGFSVDTSLATSVFGMEWKGTNSIIIADLKTDLKRICDSDEYLVKADYGNSCRVCKTKDMYVVYDFHNQSNANHYLRTKSSRLEEYPLRLDLCKNCYHTQLSYTIPPSQMFSDYIYMSGTSYTLCQYFKDFAVRTITKPVGNVLEIACNDGSLLDEYKKLDWTTYGYDPAKNIYEISSKKGHNITIGFWGVDPVPQYPELDLIVAQNVCAHVPDPVAFLKTCESVMSNNTILYIQTSQCEMVEKGQFDTIYHEHLSFFTIKSMMEAAKRAGLYIEDVEKTSIHGTSYVFKMKKGEMPREKDIRNHNLYKHEESIGLYDDLLYYVYVEKIKALKKWLLQQVDEYKSKDIPLVGYGAAAKGMTILNYIGEIPLKYIADDSKYKHGFYATNYKYLIVEPAKLTETDGPLAIVVFAWNFIDEIAKKIANLRPGKETYLIVPYPKKKVIYINQKGERYVLFEEIDTRYNSDSLYNKTLLFTHFYNEEGLLRKWVRHHAPLFDAAVLIDHHSTDNSVAIIKSEAPDSWNVVKSGTTEFSAGYTDAEVSSYENSFQCDDWRLALTTTEFLYQVGFRRRDNLIFKETDGVQAIRFNAISIIDKDMEEMNSSEALIKQKKTYYKTGALNETEERQMYGQYNRFIHRIRGTNPYHYGRHSIHQPYIERNGFILKYLYSPFSEFFSRKLQIKNKIPLWDKQCGFGFQHLVEYENLCENYREKKNLPLGDLKDESDSIEHYNKFMKESGEQLLSGMFLNMYPKK
jgi:nucleoside-diphosphate-sugar epimerase